MMKLFSEIKYSEYFKKEDIIKVDKKIWGYEYWYSDEYRGTRKTLIIEPMKSTSFQYHNYKKEVMFYKKGLGVLILSEKTITLNETSTGLLILPKVRHGIKNKSSELPLFIYEESSNSRQDDIVRLDRDSSPSEVLYIKGDEC